MGDPETPQENSSPKPSLFDWVFLFIVVGSVLTYFATLLSIFLLQLTDFDAVCAPQAIGAVPQVVFAVVGLPALLTLGLTLRVVRLAGRSSLRAYVMAGAVVGLLIVVALADLPGIFSRFWIFALAGILVSAGLWPIFGRTKRPPSS